MCDLVFGARAANRASKGGLGGADVVARQTGGYNFYYHYHLMFQLSKDLLE